MQVTIIGDLLCLMGAIAIIGYLQAGSSVRGWMPIFMYSMPVTAVSAVLMSLIALAVDRPGIFVAGRGGLFGYWASHHWAWVLYLAVVPGLVGHTGFNTLLRFFSPLVISMAFPLEPLIGSIMGFLAGLSDVPGILTWLGGAATVGALMYNTYCESRRTANRQRKAAVDAATAESLGDNGGVEMAAFTIADDGDELFVDES